jgi:hypothetical protein
MTRFPRAEAADRRARVFFSNKSASALNFALIISLGFALWSEGRCDRFDDRIEHRQGDPKKNEAS